MTDIRSLQHETIHEEPSYISSETEDTSIQEHENHLEEGDITDVMIQPRAITSHEHPERLHNNGDSESEDVTEEHHERNESIHSQSCANSVDIQDPTQTEIEQGQVNVIIPEDDDDNQPLSASMPYKPRIEQEPNIHPTSTVSSTRGRSVSNACPSTTAPSGLLPRSQRVWEMDRQAPECRRCHRRFNFLVRRHHCR